MRTRRIFAHWLDAENVNKGLVKKDIASTLGSDGGVFMHGLRREEIFCDPAIRLLHKGEYQFSLDLFPSVN